MHGVVFAILYPAALSGAPKADDRRAVIDDRACLGDDGIDDARGRRQHGYVKPPDLDQADDRAGVDRLAGFDERLLTLAIDRLAKANLSP